VKDNHPVNVFCPKNRLNDFIDSPNPHFDDKLKKT